MSGCKHEDPPATPDFDVYPVRHRVVAARPIARGVFLLWSDGLESRCHVLWLRENSPEPHTTHPVTREQQLMLTEIPADLTIEVASVDASGALIVRWSDGAEGRFHPGWLRAHAVEAGEEHHALPARQSWGRELQDQLPRFSGPAVLERDDALEAWLTAIRVRGFGVLGGLPAEPGTVERLAERVGPVRPTNFGRIFDVEVKARADSNAYTAMALPVHSDLCTREYMPGLQFLHCIRSEATGGETLLADGLRLVETLRRRSPGLLEVLTRVPILFASKARDSDYRWQAPAIGLDGKGELAEIRLSPWLRGPLLAPLEQVEAVYEALRVLFELAGAPEHQVRFRLRAGELIGFDNRRILHGRTAIDASTGGRWLRGCYVEREELDSRLRILKRRARLGSA